MEKIKYKISFYIVSVVASIGLLYYLYNFQRKLADSNFAVAVVTLVVGGIAIYLYVTQAYYKKSGGFLFTQKIIASNSWIKSIHLFASDLGQDELDKISNLYSTGEFLDKVIFQIYEWIFRYQSDIFYEKVPKTKIVFAKQDSPSESEIKEIYKPMEPFWNKTLTDVVGKYEPIYSTDIVSKLKEIAGVK